MRYFKWNGLLQRIARAVGAVLGEQIVLDRENERV
jgi:hypothetical protein